MYLCHILQFIPVVSIFSYLYLFMYGIIHISTCALQQHESWQEEKRKRTKKRCENRKKDKYKETQRENTQDTRAVRSPQEHWWPRGTRPDAIPEEEGWRSQMESSWPKGKSFRILEETGQKLIIQAWAENKVPGSWEPPSHREGPNQETGDHGYRGTRPHTSPPPARAEAQTWQNSSSSHKQPSDARSLQQHLTVIRGDETAASTLT